MLGLIASSLGCACLYLGSAHQRWLRSTWPARPARVAASVLLGLGWWALAQAMHSLAATFTFVTAVMLSLCALPYLGAHAARRRNR